MTPYPVWRADLECKECRHKASEHGSELANPDGSWGGGLVGFCEVRIRNDPEEFCPCRGFVDPGFEAASEVP